MNHTVKDSGVANKAEVYVFLELSCFLDDTVDIGNLISGSSVFSKSSLSLWNFSVHILLKPSLGNLSIILLACEVSAIVQYFEYSLALLFFGIGMKTDLFQSCGHYSKVFQICWYIECSTLTSSYFRILNSLAGAPSPPLTLFILMLPKANLTSHSRRSGSRWVIIPSWLSSSLRHFVYFFCVVLPPLLNLFCFC